VNVAKQDQLVILEVLGYLVAKAVKETWVMMDNKDKKEALPFLSLMVKKLLHSFMYLHTKRSHQLLFIVSLFSTAFKGAKGEQGSPGNTGLKGEDIPGPSGPKGALGMPSNTSGVTGEKGMQG